MIFMKDTTKLTVGYQFRHMIINNIIAVAVIFFIQMIAFGWMLEKPVLREFAGAVFTLIYFFAIYSYAGGVAKHDNKSYTELQPDKRKGLLMGVMLAAVTLVLFLGYKFVWAKFAIDGVLQNWGAVALNAVFLIWTFPYFGLMDASNGSITYYSAVIMFAVPILASTLGYIAVCNKFDLADKLLSFVYVKKK